MSAIERMDQGIGGGVKTVLGRKVSGGIANCDLVLGQVRGSLTQEVAGADLLR